MASRRELQRLEDENRTLCQRLSDTEVELSRKEEELKSTNIRYSFNIYLKIFMLLTTQTTYHSYVKLNLTLII